MKSKSERIVSLKTDFTKEKMSLKSSEDKAKKNVLTVFVVLIPEAFQMGGETALFTKQR